MCIHWAMQFEWDSEKARINRTKHGVELADAIEVIFDPLGLTTSDDYAGRFGTSPLVSMHLVGCSSLSTSRGASMFA